MLGIMENGEIALNMGSGRRVSNPRPSAWEGDDGASHEVPGRPAEGADRSAVEGTEGEDDPDERDASGQPVRQVARHLLGNDVPGDPWAAAWADYLAGRS